MNGCVLATSNAERAYLRVKDSQAVSQLFATDLMKPVDLVKYSTEVDKGLKAAICSLQSAETLQNRKVQEIDSAPKQTKTTQALRVQLTNAKEKLAGCQREALDFQKKVLERQKSLWAALVGDVVELSEADFKKAETSVEQLKDVSALLNSEIAEHLAPSEAIAAADQAHEQAKSSDEVIVKTREQLNVRRHDLIQCINYSSQRTGASQINNTATGFNRFNAPSVPSGVVQDESKKAMEESIASLELPQKKAKLDGWMMAIPRMLEEVNRIRNMAIQIGNR